MSGVQWWLFSCTPIDFGALLDGHNFRAGRHVWWLLSVEAIQWKGQSVGIKYQTRTTVVAF